MGKVGKGIAKLFDKGGDTAKKFQKPVKRQKTLKKIINKASQSKDGLPDKKIEQLKRVVKKAGGKTRTEVGQKGTMKGKLHTQTEGLGGKTDRRHIIHQNQ